MSALGALRPQWKVKVRPGGFILIEGLGEWSGEEVIVSVEPTKTPAQLGRYFDRVVPRIADYESRVRGRPQHPTKIHHMLEVAFLGVKPEKLVRMSLVDRTREQMSDYLSAVESHYAALGVSFDEE